MNWEHFNNYFDKIYIVTLPRATERQEKIRRVLHGLNFEFLMGADAKDFNEDDIVSRNIYSEQLSKKNNRYGKKMKPGEIGCSWSHRMIYEDVVAHNYKKVLILEDDVTAANNAGETFHQVIKELPASWDLCYFDYNKNTEYTIGAAVKQWLYHVQKLFGLIKFSHRTIQNLHARKFSNHLKTAGYHDYTSAYALSLNGAKKLLSIQTPIQFVADHLLAFAITNKIIQGYIAVPKIFIQESHGSEGTKNSYVQ